MCRHPLQCILPPYVLRRLAEGMSPERRAELLDQLDLDHGFRQLRAESAGRRALVPIAAPGASAGGSPHRSIYDQRHSTSDTPGKLVRSEGQRAVKDVSVNQAYDNFGATYTFYWEVFGRNSIDDLGMPILGLVHYGTKYDNAFWDGQGHMFFGDGDGQILTDTTKGLDVIAHELTHGVTQNTANLVYRNQSGALNESVSDVFGVMAKQYKLKQTAAQADWLIGADIVGPQLAPALRSMKDPGAMPDPQPADMNHYVKTSSDNGGVHTNSGIPNHAFYVIASTLGGNSWDAPGRIWYDTLTDHTLKPTATFSAFATITLSRARQRYGATSPEAAAVQGGWEAVKVKVR